MKGRKYSAPPKSLVVLISGSGSNLQSLMDGCAAGRINGRIKAVISSNAQAKGLVRAQNAGIPTYVFSKAEYGDARDAKMAEVIASFSPDFIILAGYLGIISPPLIERFRYKIINIHPALLPKYGGKNFFGINVHNAVIQAGDKKSGATVHYVDEGTDTGLIIRRKKVRVMPGDTPEVLQKRVLKKEHILIVETVRALCNGNIRARKIYKYDRRKGK